MSDDSVIAEFQAITGCDVERAKFYIDSANGQLDLAISSFYENDGGADVAMADASADVPPTADAASGGGGAPPAAAAAPPRGVVNFPADDSDSEEEEGQAFYAGGSAHSGNVILGPGKKKDIVGKLFKRAREAGAEEVRAGEPGSSGGGAASKAFLKGGFKLGDDSTPSQFVGQPGAGSSGGAGGETAEPRTFVLKMWQEGFSLDDGDLRRYDDPGNREFLANIMRGSIPTELIREAQVTAGSPAAAAGPSDPAQAETAAKSQAGVDESKPTTNIQVRLADGSRLIVKLNHDQTVGTLRQYICTARPQYTSVPFNLLTTFPNKELTDDSQSLKENSK